MSTRNKRTASDVKFSTPAAKKILIVKPKLSVFELKYPAKPPASKHPKYSQWKMKDSGKGKIHPNDALALKGIANDDNFPLINGTNFEYYRSKWEAKGVPTKFYGAQMIVQHFASIKKRYKRNSGAFLIPGMSNKKNRDLVMRVQARNMKRALTFQQLQYKMMTDEDAWVDPETGEMLGATTTENSATRNAVAKTYAEDNKERIEKKLSIVNREWREYCALTGKSLTPSRKPRKDRKRVPKAEVEEMTKDALSEVGRLRGRTFLCLSFPSKGEIRTRDCFAVRAPLFDDDFANEMVNRGIDYLAHKVSNGPEKSVSQLKKDIPEKLRSMGLSESFDASQYGEILRERGQAVLSEGGLLTWHVKIPSQKPWWKLDKKKMNDFDKHLSKAVYVNPKLEYTGYDLCRHTKHSVLAVSQNWENFESQQLAMGNDVSQHTERVKELSSLLSKELDKLMNGKIKGFRKKDSTIFKALDAQEIADRNVRKEVQKKRKKITKLKVEARQEFNMKVGKGFR